MSKRNWTLIIIVLGIILVLGIIYFNFVQKRTTEIPRMLTSQTENPSENAINDTPRFSTVATNLEVPWSLVFLPDKSILFTERPGRVRLIDNKNNLNPTPVAVITDVLNQGEGGLLGITIHPDFSNNHFVYLYYTYENNNDQTLNRVVRFKFENNSFSDRTIIVDKIPGNLFHNGGRIKFGPDNFLYITTGDSQNPSLAQNKNSLAGKILRVTDENTEIFSYGHRNPQGLAWDENGILYETEHGPSTLDEINIIEKDKNYGWPTIQGNQTRTGMETSILNSGSDTWAPSGTAYLNGSIFFGGLRGQALFEYNVESKTLTPHLKGEIGRIRDVVVGPDNLLYITTSNRDGRGIPDSSDDKILRVNPAKL